MARRPKDDQRIKEILSKEVNVDGRGEHPLVQKILDPRTATETSASELFQLMRQFNEQILGKVSEVSDVVSKLVDRIERIEEAQKRFEENRESFFRDADERLNRTLKNISNLDAERAKGAKIAEEAYKEARINLAMERLKFAEQLKSEPVETVKFEGVPMTIRDNDGVIRQVMMPLELRIYDQVFIFPPNKEVTVPRSVAAEFRRVLRDMEVLRERENALRVKPDGSINSADEVARRWLEISEKYQQPTDNYTVPRG